MNDRPRSSDEAAAAPADGGRAAEGACGAGDGTAPSPASKPSGGPAPVAIVTGASRGIGRAAAIELARRGFAVAVNYRQDEAGARAAAREIEAIGRPARPIRADVADPADVAAMFRAVDEDPSLGAPAVVVCNAGVTRDTLLGASEPADFDAVLWNDAHPGRDPDGPRPHRADVRVRGGRRRA